MTDMALETALATWDGELMVSHYDHPTGAWMLIAVHSTRLGPAVGGTRMKAYASLAAAVHDAQQLAAGMTYKLALSGLPYGGGKAVLALPPTFDPAQRALLLRRFGHLIAQLGGLYRTGPDVGTSPADMDLIAEIGAPYVFSRTVGAGGAGDSAPPTAVGVFAGIQATCAALGLPLAGTRVLVQGAGSVGSRLLALLQVAGAQTLVSETDPAALQRLRLDASVTVIEPAAAYATDCDIFAPCALGGVLSAETIPQLRCRAVVGSANNQLAQPADAERLRARNILYAPDYVISLGGALAIIGQETLGWSREEAERRVASAITQTLTEVYASARDTGATTTAAAQALTERRLADGPPSL